VKILIGLIMAGVAGPVAWWAFNRAVSGQDFYNWIWAGGLIVTVIGILTIIAQIGKWMRS